MSALWNIPKSKGNVSVSLADVAKKQSNTDDTEVLMDNLREQLVSRGARGMVGLQRKFRIIDDDNTKSLSLSEFKKAMKECSLKLSDIQLNQLFSFFDKSKDGSIDFDEFIIGIRVRVG